MKTYANNLVEGIISDSILTRVLSDDAEDEDRCNVNEETDVSLSLATEETETAVVTTTTMGAATTAGTTCSPGSTMMTTGGATSTKSPSSHVETDSLDESEHAGQHS